MTTSTVNTVGSESSKDDVNNTEQTPESEFEFESENEDDILKSPYNRYMAVPMKKAGRIE